MTIELTERATEILARSYEAARRFNPDVHLRLARIGNAVEAVLAESPGDGDEALEGPGFVLHVEAGLDGRLEVHEPHDRLVLVPFGGSARPPGSGGSPPRASYPPKPPVPRA